MIENYKSHFADKKGSERNFGIVFGSLFCLVTMYGIYADFIFLIILGSLLAAIFFWCAFLSPKSLIVPNVLWVRLGGMLAIIVSPIILILSFIGPILLVGLMMQIFGKNVVYRTENSGGTTWQNRSDKNYVNMEDQF